LDCRYASCRSNYLLNSGKRYSYIKLSVSVIPLRWELRNGRVEKRKAYKSGAHYCCRGENLMATIKDQILRVIQDDAAQKLAALAGEYVRSKPQEREAILAGLDFERWLEQCCRECLNQPKMLK
jgi:hypothetical protein